MIGRRVYRSRNITWDDIESPFPYNDDGTFTRETRATEDCHARVKKKNKKKTFAEEFAQKSVRNYTTIPPNVYEAYVYVRGADAKNPVSRGTCNRSAPRGLRSDSPRAITAFPAYVRRSLARGRISPGKAEADAATRGHFPVATRQEAEFSLLRRGTQRRRRTSRSASENVVWRDRRVSASRSTRFPVSNKDQNLPIGPIEQIRICSVLLFRHYRNGVV